MRICEPRFSYNNELIFKDKIKNKITIDKNIVIMMRIIKIIIIIIIAIIMELTQNSMKQSIKKSVAQKNLLHTIESAVGCMGSEES